MTHPVDAIRAALATRPRVRLLIVHHATDVVIGGEDAACRELVSSLGARAVPINHDLVVHCPELEPFADTWYRVHHRDTQPIATPRLYANAVNRSFAPTAHRCAEMLTEQARHTVIFDATVKQAHEDGVRCFVELGPRNACSGWIREILGDEPHVACAVDGTRGTIREAAEALTIVADAGYAVDTAWWNAQMADLRLLPPSADAASKATDGVIQLSGHRALPAFDAPPAAVLRMPPAPILAPALPDRLLPVGGAPDRHGRPRAGMQQDVPVPVFDTSMDIAALVALSSCQHALLQVQELAIRHLMATGPDEAEPLTFAATAIPEAEPDVQIVEAVAIDDEASPALGPGSDLHARAARSARQWPHLRDLRPAFAAQDSHPRQVRMPMPPLLLADRVVGLLGEPGEHAHRHDLDGDRRARPTRGTSTRAACPPAS